MAAGGEGSRRQVGMSTPSCPELRPEAAAPLPCLHSVTWLATTFATAEADTPPSPASPYPLALGQIPSPHPESSFQHLGPELGPASREEKGRA